MFYQIWNSKGIILTSNVPSNIRFDVTVLHRDRSSYEFCDVMKAHFRQLYSERSNGRIYLRSYEQEISGKILGHYVDACFYFLDRFAEFEQAVKEREQQNFRRLRHNLVTHNTNMLQELERMFPIERMPKGGSAQVDYVKGIIENSLEETALLILRLNKTASFMKSDIDVYEMLTSPNPYLEIDSHPIHKVVTLVLHVFWLDFIEKGVSIDITDTSEKVKIDYKSMSVILSHFYDNAVKYIAPNTDFKIRFIVNGPSLHVIFEMTSLIITDQDYKRITDENVSGYYAQRLGTAGDGIGMNAIARLLKLNKATFKIDRNIDPARSFVKMAIPYERNRFIMILRR